jgi:hypothetical protein
MFLSYRLTEIGHFLAGAHNKQTLWPESAREPYRPSDRLLSTELVPTFAVRGCHMVSVTDPYGNILGFLDRSRYFSFQVAPQLYSRGWMDHVAYPLLLWKSGSSRNRTRTSGSARDAYRHKNAVYIVCYTHLTTCHNHSIPFISRPT